MTVAAVMEALDGRLDGRVQERFSLSAATTYRLGGPAALYVEPSSVDDVRRLSDAIASAGNEIEILVLGRGSNVVVSDAGFPGVVVRLGAAFGGLRGAPSEDVSPAPVDAGSAATLPQVANWAARRALGGVEWMIAIPGSVGGAVRMNAGAHGGDVAAVLERATVFDLRSGTVQERAAGSLSFSYRRSNLQAHEVVLDARLSLTRAEPADIRRRMDGYRDHRARTQPGAAQNAGSVFKNPPGDSAGRLVEAAGLKGFSVGGAHVSRLHANFFIAEEGSSAQDVYDLVHLVRERVMERWGVELEPEIRFIGTFENSVAEGAR